MSQYLTFPSTWAALAILVVAGFMAQPTFASFLIHFGFMPILLIGLVWLVRRGS